MRIIIALILLVFASTRAVAFPPLRVPSGVVSEGAHRIVAGLAMSEALNAWAERELSEAFRDDRTCKPYGLLGVYDTAQLGPDWTQLFRSEIDARRVVDALGNDGPVGLVVVSGAILEEFLAALRASTPFTGRGRFALTGPFKTNRGMGLLHLDRGRWYRVLARRLYAVVFDATSAQFLRTQKPGLWKKKHWEFASPVHEHHVIASHFDPTRDCRRMLIRNLH